MAVGTEEPTADTTVEPITPTVVTDQGRGDSLLRFPSDYKSNLYGEDKSYHKGLSPYKSYEVLDGAKRMAYDMTNGNEVEKGLKVYKVSLPLSPLICLPIFQNVKGWIQKCIYQLFFPSLLQSTSRSSRNKTNRSIGNRSVDPHDSETWPNPA